MGGERNAFINALNVTTGMDNRWRAGINQSPDIVRQASFNDIART